MSIWNQHWAELVLGTWKEIGFGPSNSKHPRAMSGGFWLTSRKVTV